jgi:hypothetical protein
MCQFGDGEAQGKKSKKRRFFVAFFREAVNKEAWQLKLNQNGNPTQRS